MLAFTLVFRHSDALPLSADVEGASSSSTSAALSTDLTSLKSTAKSLLRRLSPGAQGGSTSQNYFTGGNRLLQIDMQAEASFIVLLDRGVLFLTLNHAAGCPGHPGSAGAVSVAASYLEEIAQEFGAQFGEQVATCTRPFPFLRFDNFLSKTKKMYSRAEQQQQQQHSAILARRAGAPPPTKASFYKIMGLVDPNPQQQGDSGIGGGSLSSGNGRPNSNVVLYIAVAVAAVGLVITVTVIIVNLL